MRTAETSKGRRRAPASDGSLPAALNRRWRELCALHLPLAPPGSIWRYSRARAQGDPEQGWKLHVSATVLTAGAVLEAIAPALEARGAQFKAPASLDELSRLNSGLYYGYSQVGKFLTVYPRTDAEAVSLAELMHELTRQLSAPAVPFDRRLAPGSSVYYRYGSFAPLEIENPDGTRTHAIRDPSGALVPDARDSTEKPSWIADPLADGRGRAADDTAAAGPLRTTYRVYKALMQRGKGGVYQALDVGTFPPRFCVIKEGRRDGETGWDGRDGRWRVRHEGRVLDSLRAAGVEVPRVLSSFESESNFYLVTEYVEGLTLHALLRARRRRLAVAQVTTYAARLADLISRIHAAGWTWRDCKPTNIVVTKAGTLRPLDFEGACPVNRPDPQPWGTPPFIPPEGRRYFGVRSRAPEDLYALGSVTYLLLTGVLPAPSALTPAERLRPGAPAPLCELISALLDADPGRRPPAAEVARRLGDARAGWRAARGIPSQAAGAAGHAARPAARA